MKYPTRFLIQPGWKLLLRDMGFNPADVLRLAGMRADLFVAKDASVDPAEYFRLWTALEGLAGAASLPLMVGRAISVEAFDPPIFASLCSPNLTVALRRLAGFKRLMGPITLQVDSGAAGTTAVLGFHVSNGALPDSLALMELVFITHLTRLGTRHRIVPTEVVVDGAIPLGRLPEYLDYFGVAPVRGDCNRVSFSAVDAERPFLTSNEPMWEFFEAGLRQRLADLDAGAGMRERVKAALLEGLPAGQYQIDAVARQLAVSKRTLQRLLGEEGTSFSDVLTATRYELAAHYLRRPSVAQGEIAFLLGFQDISSFNRAFKDWAGVSPGAFRHQC